MKKKNLILIFVLIVGLLLAVIVVKKGLLRGGPGKVTTTTEQAQTAQIDENSLLTRSDEMPFERPFGLHGTFGNFDQVQDLGANIVRRHLLWDKFEPVKGQYQLSEISGEIAGYQNIPDFEVLIDLDALSSWGGNIQAQAIENKANAGYHVGLPSDINAWTSMVTYIVEKLDGDGNSDVPGLKKPVKYWQVEQEWIWQWKDTPENYVKFLKITSEAVKKADPEAKIVTGALTSVEVVAFADGYLDDRESIDAGGRFGNVTKDRVLSSPEYKEVTEKIDTLLKDGQQYFDVLDFHAFTQDPYVLEGTARWLKDRSKKYGASGRIWSTENAGPFGRYSERDHAAQVVQRYMIAANAGVERLLWNTHLPLNGWPEKYVKLSLVDRQGNKKPAYFAYKTMTEKLRGLTNIRRIKGNDQLYAYEIYNVDKRVFVVWLKNGSATVDLPFDESIRVTHIWNGPNGSVSDEIIEPRSGKISLDLTTDPIFVEIVE